LLQLSNDLERRDMGSVARATYRLWLRIQGRWIDHFVAMAGPLADEAQVALAVSADRITTIGSPVFNDEELCSFAGAGAGVRAALRRPVAGRRYLAVGRLVPQKNFGVLIDAFAVASGMQDRLIIVGEGPEHEALVRRAERLSIRERLELPGYSTDLASYFQDCDQFVLSSDYEGLPAVLVEALASGVPIVATRCSAAVDELLDHGRLGRIIPIGNAKALAAAMAPTSFAADPAAMLRKASQFTVAGTAPLYVAAMQSFCHRSARGKVTSSSSVA